MNVKDFFEAQCRMCKHYASQMDRCVNCPLVHVNGGENCNDKIVNNYLEAIKVVEQWAKDNPVKTYWDNLHELLPNANKEKIINYSLPCYYFDCPRAMRWNNGYAEEQK